MVLNINVSEMEDKLLNPLNSIIALTYNTSVSDSVALEIQRIITELEDKQLINPRRNMQKKHR